RDCPMQRIDLLMLLIPALPLAASLATALLGRHVLRNKSNWPAILATIGSFLLSMLLLGEVRQAASAQAPKSAARDASAGQASSVGYEHILRLWNWASVDNCYV